MKIMQINRLWRASREIDRYALSLSELLEENGHEIVPFAVQDSGNEYSEYSSLFVSPLEVTKPFRSSLWRMTMSVGRIFFSRESRSRAAILADLTHPDVAHAHKIYLELSPSVLAPLSRRGVGLVMTVHDNKLFCPSHRSYRDGKACFDCRPFHYLRCVEGVCVRGSWPASVLCAAELMLHDLMRAYTKYIDIFVAPSNYIVDRLRERGIDEEKIAHVPNFVDTDRWPESKTGTGEYVLFSGRLLPREGINTMIKAFSRLPNIQLKIAGTSAQDYHARKLAEDLGADNIEFLGYRSEEDIRSLLSNCRFACIPYESPMNPPELVFHAFASGKPVIGTRLGGLPEMVRDGHTGVLVEPNNEDELEMAVGTLWDDSVKVGEMGANARRLVEEEYSSGLHYERILEVYRSVKRK